MKPIEFMLIGILKWIPWRMRTAMVGKDKIWSGEVNRHLVREKEFKFFGKIEREEAPPTERAEWNEFIKKLPRWR